MYRHLKYTKEEEKLSVKGEKATSLVEKAELNINVHSVSKLALVPKYGRES